jgi:hypothetical protein
VKPLGRIEPITHAPNIEIATPSPNPTSAKTLLVVSNASPMQRMV